MSSHSESLCAIPFRSRPAPAVGSDRSGEPVIGIRREGDFRLAVRVTLPDGEGPVGFFGPFTQGPPKERFVYVNAGRQLGRSTAAGTAVRRFP